MPPEIAERLARLNELTSSELKKLQGDIVKEFDNVDKIKDKSADDLQRLEDLATAAENVTAEQGSRAEADAAAEQRAQELRDKMHPVEDAAGDTETPEVPVVEDTTTEDGGEKDAETDPNTGLPIAASGQKVQLPTLARLNAARKSDRMRPAVTVATARTVAQFNSNGLKPGDKITSREQFDALMYEKVYDVTRVRGNGEKHMVASVFTEYPEDRYLGQDLNSNEEKIERLTSKSALLASGGICGPVAVDYDILILSSNDEPLGDSLPTFNADRGGVRYILPPTFTSVGSSATSLWTAANDLSPTNPTVKPIQTIQCGTVVESYVTAIPTRLKFGNMQDRFFPELIAANTNLALANAARVKELFRLAAISASSTVVSSGQLLGATRDAIATLDQAAAALRYRSRLARNTPLHVVLPEWAKDMFRADLAREAAHNQDGGWNSLAVTDAQVESLFSDRGVNVTWMVDGQAAVTAAPASGLQGFTAQTANATLQNWPTTLVWWLFPEGTFQRLDGGQMDFGVIRDSTLDATNDYETMIEVFENVIYRGFESLEIVSSVRPNGASAGNILTATSPSIY